MNFIKNLFKGRNNGRAETQAEVNSDFQNTFSAELPETEKELFTDEGAAEKINISKKEKSLLSGFLETDFYTNGFNDGYDYPSDKIMETSMAKIKTDFILIIEKTTDELNKEIIKRTEFSINVSDISDKTNALAENSIAELRKLILKLIDEKNLCRKNEGMILTALNKYRLGFEKGLFTYTQEKMIISGTGLF